MAVLGLLLNKNSNKNLTNKKQNKKLDVGNAQKHYITIRSIILKKLMMGKQLVYINIKAIMI